MSLFDRTFLISTGVTAIICGALYYYLNTKIRELEQALVKQNQVLSSFIANVQQEFRAMAMARASGVGASGVGASGVGASGVGASGMTFEIVTNSNELASPEALAAVAELENRKIVISDSDCDSESEDDSASEADASEADASETDASEADASEDDSNSDAESVEHNKLVICDLSLNDMKIIDMSSLGISHLEIYTPEKQSEDEDADQDEADASDSEESDADDDSEEDGFHRISKLVIEEVNLNVLDLLNTTSKVEEIQVEEIQVEELLASEVTPAPSEVTLAPSEVTLAPTEDASDSASKEITNYDDLKVDELRKIVLEKGLAQKEDVKKLKKNELLALLKKHTLL
jgi:hypothetical protein